MNNNLKILLSDFEDTTLKTIKKYLVDLGFTNNNIIISDGYEELPSEHDIIILGNRTDLTKNILANQNTAILVITEDENLSSNFYSRIGIDYIPLNKIEPFVLSKIIHTLVQIYQLNTKSQYFETLNDSPIGIYEIDPAGNFVLADSFFLKMLGLKSENQLKSYNAFKKGISTNGKREKLKKLLLEHGVVKNYNDEWQKYDNSKIFVSENISAKRDIDGNIKHYIGVVEEVSNIEKNILKYNDKIENLKSMFLSQLSHEIRTPLSTIINHVSLLKESKTDIFSENWSDSFKSISNSSNRIVRTIDTLVKMSEVETDNFEPIFKNYDLINILEPIVFDYKSFAIGKGIKLNLTKNLSTAIVTIDKSSVEDIITNILDNAIKYTEHGEVKVYIKRSIKNKVAITFLDTGIGISKKYTHNLFKPFTQESTGYTRKYDGNGLGLALVKEYCKINNAEIYVNSEKNIGSNFTVVFNDTVALS